MSSSLISRTNKKDTLRRAFFIGASAVCVADRAACEREGQNRRLSRRLDLALEGHFTGRHLKDVLNNLASALNALPPLKGRRIFQF